MAIITAAVLNLLRTGMQKRFEKQYKAMNADGFQDKVATLVPSTDAMETYGWLGDFPAMREWVGDRVFKSMKENGYQIVNREWEASIEVPRPVIMDDKFGTLTPRIDHMAQAAARLPEELIAGVMKQGVATLCYDGQNFFDTDHPVAAEVDGTGAVATVSNYNDGGGAPGPAWYLLCTSMPLRPFIFQERMAPEFESLTNPGTDEAVFTSNKYRYGIYRRCAAGFGFWQCAYRSHAALTDENFEAAEQAMAEFTADGGRPLGIKPDTIVVPPSLKSAARRLFQTATLPGGGDNPLYNQVKVIDTAWVK